jgi:hypothetical protein
MAAAMIASVIGSVEIILLSELGVLDDFIEGAS